MRDWVGHLTDVEKGRKETTKRFWSNYYWKGLRGKVLDVGCGIGWMAIHTPNDSKYFGIDNDDGLVKYCRKLKLNVKTGSITKIPYKNNYFDGVFASNVIEHLTPVECLKAFKEMSRVLKRGGILKVVTPSMHDKKFWDEPTHIRPFTKVSLERLFKATKFDSVEIEYEKFIPGVGGVLVDILKMPRVYENLRKLSLRRDMLVAVGRKI